MSCLESKDKENMYQCLRNSANAQIQKGETYYQVRKNGNKLHYAFNSRI